MSFGMAPESPVMSTLYVDHIALKPYCEQRNLPLIAASNLCEEF